jgi:hypothetical protein
LITTLSSAKYSGFIYRIHASQGSIAETGSTNPLYMTQIERKTPTGTIVCTMLLERDPAIRKNMERVIKQTKENR